jgi:hypothetical protein
MCMIGFHEAPPQRNPPGPIVATCPWCGKTTYFYGMSLNGISHYHYPTLMTNFPRVLGTTASMRPAITSA